MALSGSVVRLLMKGLEKGVNKEQSADEEGIHQHPSHQCAVWLKSLDFVLIYWLKFSSNV